jgi:hypothetical protein
VASIKQVGLQIAWCAGLFAAGVAVGSLHPTNVSAQNKFGQPKTVLHVVVYKFKDATSENDRQKPTAIRSATSAASTPSSSPARKPPPITRKVPRTKPGPNNGKLSAKTAYRSKSPTLKNTRPDKLVNSGWPTLCRFCKGWAELIAFHPEQTV